MASFKDDKPSNVTSLREKEAVAPVKQAAKAIFTFEAVDDDIPEMAIDPTAQKSSAIARNLVQGADLSGQKKVIFFVGRGKTGKTTLIRWLSETALAGGGTFIMADMDPTNDTFSQYIEGVSRPAEPGDPLLALIWLERLLQHAMDKSMSVVVDLGGGDTTLRRLVAQLPEVVSMFEQVGFAVILLTTVGPQEEDLSPLATMMSLNVRPTATAIVLNEGLIDVGIGPEQAFARILRHSVFIAAVTHGAVPIWMPRLIPAAQIEMRRLPFRDAAAGQPGQGKSPLGPFDRARVTLWLTAMEASFAGIATWLP